MLALFRTPRPRARRGLAFALLAFYALAGSAASRAAGETLVPCSPLRPQDQVWLVSQRGLGCQVEHQTANLKYWRYDPERRWVRSTLAELQAADDGNLVTTIFAHGNRIDSCEAFTTGWRLYRSLIRCADEQPVRFIIWSWPSEKICGPVQDTRIKAARTNAASYYLAWFVDQLGPDEPVGLWGYSFGARIVTGALHLLGGGQLAGRQLHVRAHEERAPARAVLIAAALDNDWLLPGHAHGLALSQVDQLLLVNNSCDSMLRRYHMLYHRRSCRQALGYTGLPSRWVGSDAWDKLAQLDACCQVGHEHALVNYLCASCLMAPMRDVLLFAADRQQTAPDETPPGETLAAE